MKTSKLFIIASFSAILLGAQLFAQDAQSLQYKFVKGKTYLYSTVSSANITQEMGGQEMKMSNASRFTLRTVVDEVKNGSAMLIVSADSAVSSTKNPMRDTTMILTNMIDKRMKIGVSKIGEILSREIIDTIQYQGQGRGAAQREFLTLLVLPTQPVKMGDKWTTSKTDTVEQMGGKIITSTQFEFSHNGQEKKLNHDCLKLAFTGKITTNGNMKMQGMELFVEGGGKVTGTFYFDAVKGLPVLVESATDTETTMAATGQQQMTIPISSSQKSITTLVGE